MGKADQQKTQNAISEEQTRSRDQQQSGIGDTQNRVSTLMPSADSERGNILDKYNTMASTGGISQADRDRLNGVSSGVSTPSGSTGTTGDPGTVNIDGGGSPGGSSGSGGGSGGLDFGLNQTPNYLKVSDDYLRPTGGPDYIGTFGSMTGADGGFDANRLANINQASSMLRDTSGNYKDVNNNINSLTKFADTGGLNASQLGNINRQSLLDMESNGGYTDADKANIRSRSNSGLSSAYGAMQSDMDRAKAVSGQSGPGWDAAAFKLARQGAQDTAQNTRNTEADIVDKTNANKMAAGQFLSTQGLGTAGLQSNNTLTGYTNSGQMGLTRQKQIDDATEASANIDLGAQKQINDSRLAAATGLSTDTIGKMDVASKDALGRMSTASNDATNRLGIASQNQVGNAGVGASASAANAALNAANERFLIGERDQGMQTGTAGLLSTYGTANADLTNNQNLLRGYRQDASGQNQGLIQDRIGASTIPGLGSTISSGLKIGGQVAGLASGLTGAFPGMMQPQVQKLVSGGAIIPNGQGNG